MSQLQLFARLLKVDEAKRQVTGIIASETPDRANEVFDYDSSKPNFEAWSNSVAKMSDGKSVGNLRAMHSNIAAGAVTEMVFDDVAKTISITAEVVDDNEWQKCLKGVYTGFSIGGKYLRKWADDANKALKRYTAAPSEVSLVDIGCNPDAGFVLCKADGMEETVAFHVPDTAELMVKIADANIAPGLRREYIYELAKAHGIQITVPALDDDLAKGAYSIERLACAAESCESLMSYHAINIDGTVRSFSEDVKKAAGLLYDALLKMVSEDVAAAKDRLKGIRKQADDDAAADLAKRADELTVVNETLAKLGTALGVGEGEELLAKASALTAQVGELTESVSTLTIEKAALADELAKVKAEPVPARSVRTLAVGKEEDGLSKSADSGNTATADAVKDPLSLMKAAHARPIPATGLAAGRHNLSGG